jgi:pilus assembly protein CpaE
VTAAVALLSPDPELDARVRALVDSPAADVRRWRDEYLRIDPTKVAAELVTGGAEVVVVGPEFDGPDALGLAQAFDIAHPNVCVVMLVSERSAEVWEGALAAGVRGVMSPGAPDGELRAVLSAAMATAARRRSAVAPPADAQERSRARTLVVLSPKGGAGKTTLAVNLSVILARAMPNQVALLDLDLQFGDVAPSLQITPQHTLADVARATTAVDATSVKVFLSSHPSGLWVLAAPDTPPDADDISAEHAAAAVRLLGEELPIVVVDTAAGLNEHTLAVLEHATDLMLMSSMDVSSIRSLRKELDVLDALGISEPRRHLVLNRADSKVGLDVQDVETVLGMSVDLALPSTRAVPLALNQGIPLIESDPRAPATRQLEQLAARFTPQPSRMPGASRRLRRREGR